MYLQPGLSPGPRRPALFLIAACSWVDGYSSTAHQRLLMLERFTYSSSAMRPPRRSTDNYSGKRIARFVSNLAWR